MSEKDKSSINKPEIITAPFSSDQVLALNLYQKEGLFHPFTCGGKIHEQSSPDLIAEKNGWVCPDNTCDYTQNWAHSFMAERPLLQAFRRYIDPK